MPPVRGTAFQSSFEWRNRLMHNDLRVYHWALDRDAVEQDGSTLLGVSGMKRRLARFVEPFCRDRQQREAPQRWVWFYRNG